MIIHKLILQHLKHRDDADFYVLQAEDAIRWILRSVEKTGMGQKRALDLGCGHGLFGSKLMQHGWNVTFADEENHLLPEIRHAPYKRINIDRDELGPLGQFDLVICSNVLEHLGQPERFLASVHQIIAPGGSLYLSWTNWLSPWGGHEFSPFHYLGPETGPLLFDKVTKRKRLHTPYQNLFPTYVGSVLRIIRRNQHLRIARMAPRYYTEFAFLLRIPLLREFLAWNCAMLVRREDR